MVDAIAKSESSYQGHHLSDATEMESVSDKQDKNGVTEIQNTKLPHPTHITYLYSIIKAKL